MDDDYTASLKGQFLMAMPGLADPNFSQTVTCICEHTPDGAVGIVINRVHASITARDIFEELNMEHTPDAGAMPVFLGGPVHIDKIFLLHGPPFDWEGRLMVTASLAMSNTLDILRAIASGEGPESAIISIGCAGWGPNQLESEIKENVWLTGPIDEDIVFDASIESRWEEAVRKIGIDPSLLTDAAGHA